MSEQKFTIGSQWKTRGGWRAVVVNDPDSSGWFHAWHSKEAIKAIHESDAIMENLIPYKPCHSSGMLINHNNQGVFDLLCINQPIDYYNKIREFDLIFPWIEPRKGTCWVNVMESGVDNSPNYVCFSSKENAVYFQQSWGGDSCKCLARIEVKWFEGQGLEGEK